MNLRDIAARYGRRTPKAYAALCTAQAGTPSGPYPLGERHAILAMMRCTENEIAPAVTGLLESYGWQEVVVDEWEQLETPFFTTDREVRACYVSAMTSDGGLVVYTDPLN